MVYQLRALYGKGLADPSFPQHQRMRQIVAERVGRTVYQLLDGGKDGYFVVVDLIPGAVRVNLKGVVYIAGPMRGLPKYNFPAFDAARDRLIDAGFYVFNPADLDRMVGVHEDTPSDAIPADFMRDAMDRDLNAITKCTHIALLPGWEASRGVRPEAVLGWELGLKFVYAEDPGFSIPGEAVMAVVGARLADIYYRAHGGSSCESGLCGVSAALPDAIPSTDTDGPLGHE